MTLQEIKELKDMGFSVDQIMALSGTPASAPAEAPEPEEPETEETEPSEPETPAPDPRLEELEQTVRNQASQIQELTKQIQADNRNKLSIDRPPDDLDNRVDQVMAELIRPTIQKKGG